MSEYQYYEFRTINRQLSAAERTAVSLSEILRQLFLYSELAKRTSR